MGDFLHGSEMKSQTIAAVLATVIGLAVAVYAFAFVFVGDTYKSDKRVERIEVRAGLANLNRSISGVSA
jgi:predicted lysophospholipase L1 biosynthesis ABC-type transport system permease subunit